MRRVTWVVLAVLVSVAHGAAGPAPARPPGGGAARADSVPPGVLRGRVIDAHFLWPLTDAEVWVDSLARRARTDSAGRFELAGVGAGLRDVRARHVGHYPARGAVRLERERGLRVEIGMDPERLCLSEGGCNLEPTPGYVRPAP